MSRGIARLSIAELHAEIRRRSSGAQRLHAKRAKLMAKLDRLEREIEAMGGSVNGAGRGSRGGGGGRRPRNEMNLTDTLVKVLGNKTMNVTDAAAAVQNAGYRTASNNFRTQVNIALIKGPFKRVGRGEYAAK
jgi:hypothetical protein